MEEQKNKVAADLKQNVERLKKDLGVGESFDVLVREFKVGGKGVALFFVDGFAKDDILIWVMQSLFRVMREQSAPPLVSALFQRRYTERPDVAAVHLGCCSFYGLYAPVLLASPICGPWCPLMLRLCWRL